MLNIRRYSLVVGPVNNYNGGLMISADKDFPMKASEFKTYYTPKRPSEAPLVSFLLKFAFLVTISLLAGCAAIPGMDTYGMRE